MIKNYDIQDNDELIQHYATFIHNNLNIEQFKRN
jgi:hypothetical protein